VEEENKRKDVVVKAEEEDFVVAGRPNNSERNRMVET
jgi:hypothetical protein